MKVIERVCLLLQRFIRNCASIKTLILNGSNGLDIKERALFLLFGFLPIYFGHFDCVRDTVSIRSTHLGLLFLTIERLTPEHRLQMIELFYEN